MKKICWTTANYFLDVDLPVVPKLMEDFSIDWNIITSGSNKESDMKYIQSQTNCSFNMVIHQGSFYKYSTYSFYRKYLLRIKELNYDWYYFDISDFLFLFRLIYKILPIDKVTIATHNVSTPKGARLAYLARLSMRYILKHFSHFQVFSRNQRNELLRRNPTADVFYCPLMLKDYGRRGQRTISDTVRFLFFGSIVRYKRLDVLLKAINILKDKGIKNFNVNICGYCKQEDWEKVYQPLIHTDRVCCDIRRIPNELVADCFNNSDYFVMPYQDIAQSGAMTVAFNYNIPVIASELDTFKEFMTDGEDGYFFSVGDSAALASVMERAIGNSLEEYNRLRTNQALMVDKTLSADAIIKKYIEYFNLKLNANTRN